MRDELCLGPTVQAAWEDCVEAFRGDETTDVCELRIAQLRELCTRRGQSWDALQHQLTGLLADQLIYAVSSGAIEADLSQANPLDTAGLSLERRLELCREVVADVPEDQRSIVWLAYGNADIPDAFLRRGPVQFFSHRLPLTAIRDGCPALNLPEFERPTELGDPLADSHFSGLPTDPYVLVR